MWYIFISLNIFSVPSPGGLFPLPASQQIASSGSSTGEYTQCA